MTKFFVDPFAVSGTKTPIPDLIQLDGSVSYTEGFGFDYERDQATDPLAKDIPRDQTNQLFFDITSAIQQYQTHGIPDFITSTANGGTPYSYDKYARVLYDDGTNGVRPYESLISSNTSLPTDNTKWKLLVNLGSAVIIPDAVFNTGVADGDVVYWDNANVRFDKAIANGGAAQQAVGIADVTNEQVYLSGFVPLLVGLTPGAVYYLSSTTAGAITAVQGSSNVRIGVAYAATDLFLNIIVFPPNYVFVAKLSTTPSIAPSTLTLIPYDVVTYDPYGCWNAGTYQYTAKEAGYYEASILGNYNSLTAGDVGAFSILKNGAAGIELCRAQIMAPTTTVGNTPTPFATVVVFLAVGDTLAGYTTLVSTGNEILAGSQIFNQLTIRKLPNA